VENKTQKLTSPHFVSNEAKGYNLGELLTYIRRQWETEGKPEVFEVNISLAWEPNIARQYWLAEIVWNSDIHPDG
jgi:hypothetical protein